MRKHVSTSVAGRRAQHAVHCMHVHCLASFACSIVAVHMHALQVDNLGARTHHAHVLTLRHWPWVGTWAVSGVRSEWLAIGLGWAHG